MTRLARCATACAVVVVLLVALAARPARAAPSSPPTLYLRATVRDFLWAECVANANETNGLGVVAQYYCPNDAAVLAGIKAGNCTPLSPPRLVSRRVQTHIHRQDSGHIDFEQYGPTGTPSYGVGPLSPSPYYQVSNPTWAPLFSSPTFNSRPNSYEYSSNAVMPYAARFPITGVQSPYVGANEGSPPQDCCDATSGYIGTNNPFLTPYIQFSTAGIPKPQYATPALKAALNLPYAISDGNDGRAVHDNDR